ncbi:hypothetical protein [Streptococcus thoraltensis]|uniref:hypothetical protein n=1 Tax=Streptococcus thoraltensis TaxID=55085 RepID=UPI001F57C9F6|nr:hypothetical protein [Streptococcus thoraltensis]
MSKLSHWLFLLILILFASAFYLEIEALFPNHWGTIVTLFIIPPLALLGICLAIRYKFWAHLLAFIIFFLSFPLVFLLASLFEALLLNPPTRLENPLLWLLIAILLMIPPLTYRILKEIAHATWFKALIVLIISGLYLNLIYLILQLFY